MKDFNFYAFTAVDHDDPSLASSSSQARRGISGLILPVFGLFGLLLLASSEQASATDFILTLAPDNLTVNQHVGGPGEPSLVLTFTVPAGQSLVGGGLPSNLYKNTGEDKSIIQIELPVSKRNNSGGDESIVRQTEAGVFDYPSYCLRYDFACYQRQEEGLWKAQRIRPDGTREWLQLATPRVDPTTIGSQNTVALSKEIGIFLPATDSLAPGDRVVLTLHGRAPARATTWASRPLILRLRYRSDPANCADPEGCWTTLSDDQVQPLHLEPLAIPSFVHIHAPLDVVAGEPFYATIVVTDLFANPTPYSGYVRLQGVGSQLYQFNNEYRKVVQLQLPDPGFIRLSVETGFSSIRHVPQWLRVWDVAPAVTRLVGDIHSHTGDGGAQRKFLQSFEPGDHRALFTTQQDAFFYMDKIAGYDFAAVSEHAVRQDGYSLPPAVATDAAFATGGACDGLGQPIANLGNWWPLAQQAARTYGQSSNMIVFPAFEWHAAHDLAVHGDSSPLHRIVLYRNFHPTNNLPILPGDIEGLAPQCLVRFIQLAGYGPAQALIAPHMMTDDANNIDWDLTYGDAASSNIASRAHIDAYHRVGEIFSARAYSQDTISLPELLTLYEGDDQAPAPLTFRYGWRKHSAHLGVIGGSDAHSQTPGSDDTLAMSGNRIKLNEPAGTTFTLSSTVDRNGVYDAIYDRATYATTGVRAWHDFRINGSTMGQRISATASELQADIQLATGQQITRIELWATRAGDESTAYTDLLAATPNTELYTGMVQIQNPVPAGGADEEWLYYVRAFFASSHGNIAVPEDALWSSPIWVTWSNP